MKSWWARHKFKNQLMGHPLSKLSLAIKLPNEAASLQLEKALHNLLDKEWKRLPLQPLNGAPSNWHTEIFSVNFMQDKNLYKKFLEIVHEFWWEVIDYPNIKNIKVETRSQNNIKHSTRKRSKKPYSKTLSNKWDLEKYVIPQIPTPKQIAKNIIAIRKRNWLDKNTRERNYWDLWEENEYLNKIFTDIWQYLLLDPSIDRYTWEWIRWFYICWSKQRWIIRREAMKYIDKLTKNLNGKKDESSKSYVSKLLTSKELLIKDYWV